MSYSSEVLRGNTETIILAILMENDSYGYEIMKTIIERGKGLIDIKDATVYTAFKRMEKDKLITSYWGTEESGARRKYFRMSTEGRPQNIQKGNQGKEIRSIMKNVFGR